MSAKAKSDISRKFKVLQHAQESGNVSKTCRYFEISREALYWKRAYEQREKQALINSKPCAKLNFFIFVKLDTNFIAIFI